MLWIVGVGGCGAVHEQSVGQTELAIDLGACTGSGNRCDAEAPESATIEPGDPHTCEPTLRTARIAWRVEVPAGVPQGVFAVGIRDAGLFTRPQNIAVGLDGTCWFAGVAMPRMEPPFNGGMGASAFIAHYDDRGLELSASEVNFSGEGEFFDLQDIRVSVDSSGQATVAFTGSLFAQRLGWHGAMHYWIAQYAPDGTARGTLRPVNGLRDPPLQLAIAADGAVLLWGPGTNQGTAVGRLETRGAMRWTRQTLVPTNTLEAMTDSDGHSILFGQLTTSAAAEFDWSLARYDQAGNLVWARSMPAAHNEMRAVYLFGLDRGDSQLARFMSRSTDGMETLELIVQRIDSAGRSVSSTSMTAAGSLATRPVTDPAGNTYLLTNEGEEPLILAMNADGTKCSRFRIDLGDSGTAPFKVVEFVVRSDGVVYLLLEDARQWSLARLDLPPNDSP
jgi:hypothetical protein